MNKSRQSKLDKLIAQLEVIKEKLENIQAEEQEYFDNLTENQQDSEKGESSQNAIDQMEDALSYFENIIDPITDLNN